MDPLGGTSKLRLCVPDPIKRLATPLDAPVRPDRSPMGTRNRARRFLLWTHTMRRTKAALIYRRTKSLGVVQLLLGHSKLSRWRCSGGDRGNVGHAEMRCLTERAETGRRNCGSTTRPEHAPRRRAATVGVSVLGRKRPRTIESERAGESRPLLYGLQRCVALTPPSSPQSTDRSSPPARPAARSRP